MNSNYSELIYTRCRYGIIDIKEKNIIDGGEIGGFKIFSCSENITEENVDLKLLEQIAQKEESHIDPDFMDDAYLFLTPDYGDNFLVNYHPIPFVKHENIDYPQAKGNFINQIFIGKFAGLYPYETFGDKDIWYAKEKGEKPYYKDKPNLLLQCDLKNRNGYIKFDDIANFVKNGRSTVLKKAIDFIITQYSVSPEKRRFLVIKDENSKNIELWIAAIEIAFSPRMSSKLSFATRLDKFADKNKYRVNLSGKYEKTDYGNPNQTDRWRAMIVGVDERDLDNFNNAKTTSDTQFVVLDGKEKTLSPDVEVSRIDSEKAKSYYDLATSFDEKAKLNEFCRNFLQMIDICNPSEDVFSIYDAFENYLRYKTSGSVHDIRRVLFIIEEYNIIKTDYFIEFYDSVKHNFKKFLSNDVDSAFDVYNWLKKASNIIGEDSIIDFTNDICEIYMEKVFRDLKSKTTEAIVTKLKNQPIESSIAECFAEYKNIAEYDFIMQNYSTGDWGIFFNFVKNLLQYYDGNFPETFTMFFIKSIIAAYKERKTPENTKAIIFFLNEHNPKQVLEILISEIKKHKDNENYINFLIRLIINISPEKISLEKGLDSFYKEFKEEGLEKYFNIILLLKAGEIKFSEMKDYLQWIIKHSSEKLDFSLVVKELDNKLSDKLADSDKFIEEIASMIIQCCAFKNCINSLHIYALKVIDDKKQKDNLKSILEKLSAQGFPTCKDADYAEKISKKIFSNNLSDEIFDVLVEIISCSDLSIYSEKLVEETFHQSYNDVANLVRSLAILNGDEKPISYIENAFIDKLSNYKKLKKIEKEISEMDNKTQKYFEKIKEKALPLQSDEDGELNSKIVPKIKKSFNKFKIFGAFVFIIIIGILCGRVVTKIPSVRTRQKIVKTNENSSLSKTPVNKNFVKNTEKLFKAIEKNDNKKLTSLISKGADVNRIGSNNLTPLSYAIRKNKRGMVSFLIKNGANPNLVSNGLTPLVDAIVSDKPEIVSILLKNGADPNLDVNGQTPLAYAISLKNTEAIKLLNNYGVDANEVSINFFEQPSLNNTIDDDSFYINPSLEMHE